MPCQPCLCDGIWTAWNYLWQKYELFSTFFHYFPKFSTIFSTAQLCFSRSIKAFCRHVSSGQPPPPGPSPSLICTPSLRPSLVHPPIVDHLSSLTSSTTSPPSLHRSSVVHHFVPHFVDHLSAPTSSLPCPPSHRRSFVVHHFIDHFSSITYPPLFVTFHHSPPGLTAF